MLHKLTGTYVCERDGILLLGYNPDPGVLCRQLTKYNQVNPVWILYEINAVTRSLIKGVFF